MPRDVPDAAPIRETLARLVRAMAASGVRYHLTGGLALTVHAEPRTTFDIDVVLPRDLSHSAIAGIRAALTDRFLFDEALAVEAIETGGMFQALDLESYVKVDFHVGESVPGELGRGITVEVYDGILAPVVGLDDAVISKLQWVAKGSERSRRDVRTLLRAHRGDRTVLESRAAALGVLGLLRDIEAGPEPL